MLQIALPHLTVEGFALEFHAIKQRIEPGRGDLRIDIEHHGQVGPIRFDGDPGHAAATAAALLVGAVAYAALFTWAGLAVRHALPFGVAYIFVWEAALSSFLGGTRFFSVRQYTLAVVHGIDDSRLRGASIELGLIEGLIGAAVAVAVFTALATRRLGRMDIP